MTDVQVREPVLEPGTSFAVDTIDSNDTTAWLRATGTLNDSAADLLEEVVAGHLRAGRRDLRLDIRGLMAESPAALSALHRLNRQALAVDGALVLSVF